MTIQENLMAKMKEAGISQTEVGRRLGTTRQNINGKLHRPGHRFSYILAIADCIGLECRLTPKDGDEFDELLAKSTLETARKTEMSTEAFDDIIKSLGWSLDFIWKQGSDKIPTDKEVKADD